MLLFDHILVSIVVGLLCIKFFKPEKFSSFEIAILFAIGATIPDVIDKPLYYIFGFGRSLMHSMVVTAAILLVLLYLFRDNYRYKFAAMIFYAMACLHYIMDSMWQTPKILLFPLLGVPPEWGTFGFTPTEYLTTIMSYFTLTQEVVITAICGFILLYLYKLEHTT